MSPLNSQEKWILWAKMVLLSQILLSSVSHAPENNFDFVITGSLLRVFTVSKKKEDRKWIRISVQLDRESIVENPFSYKLIRLRQEEMQNAIEFWSCSFFRVSLVFEVEKYRSFYRTVVHNNQEPRCKYWATRSSVCLFTRTAQLFAHSPTSFTPSLMRQWMIR